MCCTIGFLPADSHRRAVTETARFDVPSVKSSQIATKKAFLKFRNLKETSWLSIFRRSGFESLDSNDMAGKLLAAKLGIRVLDVPAVVYRRLQMRSIDRFCGAAVNCVCRSTNHHPTDQLLN